MRVGMGGRAISIAFAALTGCATVPRTFQCPTAGGPPWRQLASERFILRTDLAAVEAGELLGRVERLRAAVVAGLPGGAPEPSGRVEIIAFRTLEEFRPFAPENALGYYVRYEGGPPRIVVPGELGPWQRAMLAHELSHDLLAGAYKRQPRWFAEGLAVYMESVEEGAQGTRVTVGMPSKLRFERARKSSVPVRELLVWDGTPALHPGVDYYASAWLLVHWLVHARPEAFAEIRRHLVQGGEPEVAWRTALPEYDPASEGSLERLDAVLAAYVKGKLGTSTRDAEAVPVVGYFEQPLATPEVHAVRLAIWQFRAKKTEAELRSEVRETLEEDGSHPIALEYLGVLDRQDPAPLARLAVAGHPADARAYTFLARSLTGPEDGSEREAAYRRALALSPRNPAAYLNLGQELRASGRPAEALPLVRQAAHLAPWSTQVLAGYAAVLADLGRCDEADAAERSAMDAMPERSTGEERRNIQERLRSLTGQCRAGPAAGPGGGAP